MGVASICDISTFLGKDPYYPFYSISKRYSFLNADISQGNTSLYLTFSKAYDPSSYDSINIIFESMVNLSSDDISLFLIDSFNIVRGPKEGIIPTSEDEVSIYPESVNQSTTCSILVKLKQDYDAKSIGAGLVHDFIPMFLTRYYEYGDPEEFWQINQTYFKSLGPDSRNLLDGTRNQGILPNCAESSCIDGQFTDHNNNEKGYVRDDIFQADAMLNVARAYVNKHGFCSEL